MLVKISDRLSINDNDISTIEWKHESTGVDVKDVYDFTDLADEKINSAEELQNKLNEIKMTEEWYIEKGINDSDTAQEVKETQDKIAEITGELNLIDKIRLVTAAIDNRDNLRVNIEDDIDFLEAVEFLKQKEILKIRQVKTNCFYPARYEIITTCGRMIFITNDEEKIAVRDLLIK